MGGESDALEEALSLLVFLGNRTRVKMLLPLLRHPGRKRHFRMQINPKLVYANLSTLKARKLIDELSEDEFALTSIGSQIFGEYLTFVQKVRRLLGEYTE
jgi:predicted transcriptional regulator